MRPCSYDLFAKVKEPLRGFRYNTRDELIRAVGRGGQCETSTKMDTLMVYDAFKTFGKRRQIKQKVRLTFKGYWFLQCTCSKEEHKIKNQVSPPLIEYCTRTNKGVDHRCGLHSSNIVASHLAGPGSIPCRVSFSSRGFFPGFFLNHKTNVRKTYAPIFPGYHWSSLSKFIHMGANDLWCWRALKTLYKIKVNRYTCASPTY